MSLAINHNITALNAWRQVANTDRTMSSSMEKLSSGLRINRAADDPAGLVISEKMRAQLTGLTAASKNVGKAINLVSTAEAALDKVNTLLNKARALAIDSANLGVNDDAMLKANQDELDEVIDSVGRISSNTQFGTKKLLDGTLDGTYTDTAGVTGASVTFQVGANENQSVRIDIGSVKAQDLGKASAGGTVAYTDALGASAAVTLFSNLQQLRSAQTASTTQNAISTTYTKGVFVASSGATAAQGSASSKSDAIAQAIAVIDKAIEDVSSLRGKLGAVQADNLEVSLDSLRISYENLQAAESTIRDTDMTSEMAEFTKLQIMMQAGTAMLAQANQLPNNVLQLLR